LDFYNDAQDTGGKTAGATRKRQAEAMEVASRCGLGTF
jgi:hypothetical protein